MFFSQILTPKRLPVQSDRRYQIRGLGEKSSSKKIKDKKNPIPKLSLKLIFNFHCRL